MAIGDLFSPVMRVLRCVVASRLVQSATGRQPTTGILLSVQQEVNIRSLGSPGVLFCRPEAFELLIFEPRRQYLRFLSNRKWLSLDQPRSSFAIPEVASTGPDTATPMTPSVKEFSVSTPSSLLLSI